MEFALDDEQSLLVTTIRRWSERALRGWAADADRRGAAPDALWGAASELGLLIDAVPSSAGGLQGRLLPVNSSAAPGNDRPAPAGYLG